MALSDYERRVLSEIEHELGRVHEPSKWARRWRRLRAAPFVQAVGWSVLVAACVCSALYAPPAVAVVCVGMVGFGLGVLAGRTMRTPTRPVSRNWWPGSHRT